MARDLHIFVVGEHAPALKCSLVSTVSRCSLASCLASLTLLGCVELPDIQWRGEHIDFGAERPELVCAGTLEYLDRRAGQILERVGSESSRIEYYFLDDIDDFCSRDDVAAGCVSDGVVYSEFVPHLHELVHARSGDGMPRVLEEGLATYLGDPYRIRGMVSRERLVELLTSDIAGIETELEYGRAAHFIAFLSESYGWEAVLGLDAALSSDSSVAQIDAAFEAVLGVGLDAALAQYEGYPDCKGQVDMSLACGEPSATLDILNTRYERVVDCASTDGVGPHANMVFVEDVIELGPTVDGSRMISGFGEGMEKGGFAVVRHCGPCPANGVVKVVNGINGFVPEEEFPAGRYVIRFYLPADAGPAVVGVGITA